MGTADLASRLTSPAVCFSTTHSSDHTLHPLSGTAILTRALLIAFPHHTQHGPFYKLWRQRTRAVSSSCPRRETDLARTASASFEDWIRRQIPALEKATTELDLQGGLPYEQQRDSAPNSDPYGGLSREQREWRKQRSIRPRLKAPGERPNHTQAPVGFWYTSWKPEKDRAQSKTHSSEFEGAHRKIAAYRY